MGLETIRVGTAGVVIAVTLYGNDCIVDVGDAFTPAIVSIPTEDMEAFKMLLVEKLKQIGPDKSLMGRLINRG